MRVRKKPWAEREISINKSLVTSPEALKGKWHEYFGNSNPIHIEIGSGKGKFINANAAINPNINYIALEKEEHIIVVGLKIAREAGNPQNLAFIIGDAKDLENYFDKGELERIYINFCDPWHRRKRWIKRRLTYRDFLFMYERLCDKCEVFLKTDNAVLFEFSLNEFSDCGWRLKNISLDLHKSNYDGNIMTEYEEKFFGLGMPIFRLEAYKAT